MGRSNEEYYQLTLREIIDNINCYLELKGLKKPEETVEEFDVEGVM